MRPEKKKIIPPILVTILMIVYYAVYFLFLYTMLDGLWRFLFGIFPLAFAIVMIVVCIERIQEIKKGEENDLSQY